MIRYACLCLLVLGAIPAYGGDGDLQVMLDRIWNMEPIVNAPIVFTSMAPPTPLQAPPQTFQAPRMPVQAPQKDVFQAPSKAVLSSEALLVPVRFRHCTLIPGRARRLTNRTLRKEAIVQSYLTCRTLLEMGDIAFGARTIMENGSDCTTCSSQLKPGEVVFTAAPAREPDLVSNGRTANLVPIERTNLTTRELLEGGQINRQVRTVNEPGVCGGNGNCNGRRGVLRRR